jgi:hypothetical protein
MKTLKPSLLLLPVLPLLLSSCGIPRYIPKPDNLSENHYGAYIKVQKASGESHKGELLSVSDTGLYLLELWKQDSVIHMARDQIKDYKLVYAEGTDYGLAYVGALAFSISHGAGSIISMPINLFALSTIQYWRKAPYTFKPKDSRWEELHQYARFPMGLPPEMALEAVKAPK